MMRRLIVLAIALSSALSFGARAELNATPLPGDARLVQFEYDPDNTFLVLTRPKSVTDVEFAADEQIITVAGGDTKSWELSPTSNRKHLFVKPVYDQIETSMTVITDKRSYQFVLRSTGAGAKWYQRVTWRYGQDMLQELRAEEAKVSEKAQAKQAKPEPEAVQNTGVAFEKLRFGYQIEGDAPFKPLEIFSDGRFTRIMMPANVPDWPALFSITEDGEAAVVNYLSKGDYMVAQQVIERGVLKLGKLEIRFTRSNKQKSWSLFGRDSKPVTEAP
jgi:type IV secretion system protein VirB9